MMTDNHCDYLIVGGGAAGCIVARRLAERLPTAQIVLLEAGKSDEGDPAATDLSRLDEQNDSYDWGYRATPTSKSRLSIEYARARMLGGCANHNDCAFIPPSQYDLNRWQEAGAKGWNAETLAPALSRVEKRLHIEPTPEGNHLSRAFINANIELGLPERNFRQPLKSGTGWFPLNAKAALRQSSSIAYLHPLSQVPKNLRVITGVSVKKIRFDGKQVIGLETSNGIFQVNVETILCAGSINTPQLLMLSGIGPVEDLSQLDIPVIVDLPGVGQNLIDHAAANITCELKTAAPPWSLTPCEATALINIESPVDDPDILFHFVLRLREKYVGKDQFAGIEHGIKLAPNVARPKSRGWLRLQSSDPNIAPEINLNYFSDDEGHDRRLLIAGLRYARKLAATNALSRYLKQEIAPGIAIESDDEIFDYVLQSCETVYHPCGTCKMGALNDPLSVVTTDLRVKEINGLRIADASVFPDMVTVNICNTVMVIGEHAAELIAGEVKT